MSEKPWSQLTEAEKTRVRVAYIFGICKTLKQVAIRFKVSLSSIFTVAADEEWRVERERISEFEIDEVRSGMQRLLSSSAFEMSAALHQGVAGLSDALADARDAEDPEAEDRAWKRLEFSLAMYGKVKDIVGDPFLIGPTATDGGGARMVGAGGEAIVIPPEAAEAAQGLTDIAVRVLMAEFTMNQRRPEEGEAKVVDVTPAPPNPTQPTAPRTGPVMPKPAPPTEEGNRGEGSRNLFVERPSH